MKEVNLKGGGACATTCTLPPHPQPLLHPHPHPNSLVPLYQIPGTTEWMGGSSPKACNVAVPVGSAPVLVGGVSTGVYGAAAQDVATGESSAQSSGGASLLFPIVHPRMNGYRKPEIG